jgi:hypothetical protein
MVSPEIVMLSVFITPWMKPTFIHCAISARLAPATRFAAGQVAAFARRPGRVVAGDGVVGQRRSASNSPRAAKILEGAHAQMAGGHARQHRAGQGVSR